MTYKNIYLSLFKFPAAEKPLLKPAREVTHLAQCIPHLGLGSAELVQTSVNTCSSLTPVPQLELAKRDTRLSSAGGEMENTILLVHSNRTAL